MKEELARLRNKFLWVFCLVSCRNIDTFHLKIINLLTYKLYFSFTTKIIGSLLSRTVLFRIKTRGSKFILSESQRVLKLAYIECVSKV